VPLATEVLANFTERVRVSVLVSECVCVWLWLSRVAARGPESVRSSTEIQHLVANFTERMRVRVNVNVLVSERVCLWLGSTRVVLISSEM